MKFKVANFCAKVLLYEMFKRYKRNEKYETFFINLRGHVFNVGILIVIAFDFRGL